MPSRTELALAFDDPALVRVIAKPAGADGEPIRRERAGLRDELRLELGTLDRPDRIRGIQRQLTGRHRVGDGAGRAAHPHHDARVVRRHLRELLHEAFGSPHPEPLREPGMPELSAGAVGDLGGDRGGVRVDASPIGRERTLAIQQLPVVERGEIHASSLDDRTCVR